MKPQQQTKLPEVVIDAARRSLVDITTIRIQDERKLAELKAEISEIQQRMLEAKRHEGELRHYLECHDVDISDAGMSAWHCQRVFK